MKRILLIGLILLMGAALGFADRNLVQDTLTQSVVLIFNETGGGQGLEGWLGSGVIVSPDGYIVTNRHVAGYSLKANGPDPITGFDTYVLEGTTPRLTVYNKDWGMGGCRVVAVSRDPNKDLAILKIESAQALPYAKIAETANFFPGDTVFAVGHPLGVAWMLTKGSISKMMELEDHNKWIIHDASLNPGNSGGPLFDEGGRIVGINFAAIPPGYAENIGIAVDARIVFQFVTLCIEFDQRRLEVMSEDSFKQYTPPTYYNRGYNYSPMGF